MAGHPPGRSFVQAAIDAVIKARATPVDMAYFAAREGKPAEYCEQQVRECDVYVVLVGFRYGSLVPDRDDGVSYTELEFRAATDAGIPRLVFLLDEDPPVPRRLVDFDQTAVEAFRNRLRQAGVIVKTVGNPDELDAAVFHALQEEAADRRRQLSQDPTGTASRVGGPPSMAPPLDRMVDRGDLGERLLEALLAPGAGEVGLTTGLHGAGGFGKTWLATWACHQPQVRERYPGGVLWATVGQEVDGAQLAERVNNLSYALCGRRPALSDPEAAGAELGRLLDNRDDGGPVLLVVDDVWEEAQLRPFRYGGRECTRMVTTRIPDLLPPSTTAVGVDAMTPGQAGRLIADGVPGLPAETTARLARLTGRWPVLLNLVNKALTTRLTRGQPPAQAGEDIIGRLEADGPTAFRPGSPRRTPAGRGSHGGGKPGPARGGRPRPLPRPGGLPRRRGHPRRRAGDVVAGPAGRRAVRPAVPAGPGRRLPARRPGATGPPPRRDALLPARPAHIRRACRRPRPAGRRRPRPVPRGRRRG
jgi:hypothetical protein